MRAFAIAIFVFLSALAAALMARDDTVNADEFLELIGRADAAAAKGNYMDAEEALRTAVALYPDNPHVPMLLSNIGMYRYTRGALDSALMVLDQAAVRAPNSVTIALNRADVLTAAGMNDRAYAELSRVLQLDSLQADARMRRGLMALSSQPDSLSRAESDLAALDRSNPTGIEAAILGAAVALHKADYAEAARRLDKVLALDPTSGLRAQRAYCRLLLDDLPGASEDIAEGLRQCGEAGGKDAGEYYLMRSMLNQRRYRPDDAEADAKMAAKLLQSGD